MRVLAILTALALAACSHGPIPVAVGQSATPGTVSVSWTAATQNTDGSPITGTLTYAVYEMAPCGSDVTCAADSTQVATVATGISGTSAQVSNVPDGLHCYTVQTLEVLPTGANVASALAALNPATDGSGSCTVMAGSTSAQSTPTAPPAVRVKSGS